MSTHPLSPDSDVPERNSGQLDAVRNGEEKKPDNRNPVSPDFVKPTNTHYRERLREVTRGRSRRIVETLGAATHPRLKHPLQVIAFEGEEEHEISVNPAHYEHTQFRVGMKPESKGGTILKDAQFGYNLRYQEFRRIGSINYVQLLEDQIKEMGFGSEEAIQIFQNHLYGRKLGEEQRERIREIQEKVFAYLRSHPEGEAALKKFAESRGWPEGIEDEAQLAYFHAVKTPLQEWAKEQGFTEEEMRLAGWYELSLSNSGQVNYSVRDSHVIRIPYFVRERMELWRTRNLKPTRAESHKYTSWPLDRSIERKFSVEEKLFNAWDLHKARGKPMVITEGEFKCLIASRLGGVFTVGIPGITEVDDDIINALVAARASEYIVILDRDPRGKGIMRVDGITDSERAAYGIALQLRTAGAEHVRVGRIPDVNQGGKVGIDDLILDHGPSALHGVMNQAEQIEEYARAIRLNRVFFDIWQTRQRVRKSLELYDTSVRRGGRQVAENIYAEAIQMRESLEELYRDFLATRFHGARRINQPLHTLSVHFHQEQFDRPERKLIVTERGSGISLDKFRQDIVYFQFFPQDTPEDCIWIRNSNLRLPFTMEEMLQYLRTGESADWKLPRTLERGLEVLRSEEQEEQQQPPTSADELGIALLAGHLSRWFPADEYTYEKNLTLCMGESTHCEEVARIPLTILKSGSVGEAVAFASLPTWDETTERVNDATSSSQRLFNLTTAFFRNTNPGHQADKFRMVMETLWPYWYERKLGATVRTMNQFGVAEEVVKQCELLHLSPEDFAELIDHFSHKRLLNQSAYVGMFRWNAQGTVMPRFLGDVVLMPVKDEGGKVSALRIFPQSIEDQTPPTLDPATKMVRHLHNAGRHLMYHFNPERHLYLQERLQQAKGKTLVITFQELDALALSSSSDSVVALNSSFDLHNEAILKIAACGAEKICFVLSGDTPDSKYDGFAYDGIPGYLKEIHDLKAKINKVLPEGAKPIPISVTVVPTPITRSAAQSPQADHTTQVVQSAVELDEYLKERDFNPSSHKNVKRFVTVSSRLLDYLEISAFPNLLDGKPIESWLRECHRQYATVVQYAKSKHKISLPTLDDYFRMKLKLPLPIPLLELVRQRKENGTTFLHRPIYLSQEGSYDEAEVPEKFRRQFDAIMEPVDAAPSVLQNALPTAIAVVPQIPVLDEELKIPNPKGRLMELHQQYPTQLSAPVCEATTVTGGFQCVVTVTHLPSDTKFSGTVAAAQKKKAEAYACQKVVQDIELANLHFHKERGTAVPSSPQAEKGATPVDNPKGRVLEILQQKGALGKNPPISDIRPTPKGFACTVTVAFAGRTFAASGEDATKKGAEFLAYRTILEEITPHVAEATAPAEQKEVIENPKGRVLEILQRKGILKNPPIPEFTETSDGFNCAVTVNYTDKIFTASSSERTKKNAEAEAYKTILAALNTHIAETAGEEEPFERAAAPARRAGGAEQRRIDLMRGIMQMPPGDKNYIGRLFQLSYRAKLRRPSFEIRKIVDGDSVSWTIKARMHMPNGETLESIEVQAEQQQETKQLAAYDLLSQIANYLQRQ